MKPAKVFMISSFALFQALSASDASISNAAERTDIRFSPSSSIRNGRGVTLSFPFEVRVKDWVYIENAYASDPRCETEFPKRLLSFGSKEKITVHCGSLENAIHSKRIDVVFKSPKTSRTWRSRLSFTIDKNPDQTHIRAASETSKAIIRTPNVAACEESESITLEGFDPLDQDQFNACYAATLSLLLKTGLKHRHDVSFTAIDLLNRSVYKKGGDPALVALGLQALQIPLQKSQNVWVDRLVESGAINAAKRYRIVEAYKRFQDSTQSGFLNPLPMNSQIIRTQLIDVLESELQSQRQSANVACDTPFKPDLRKFVDSIRQHFDGEEQRSRDALSSLLKRVKTETLEARKARNALDQVYQGFSSAPPKARYAAWVYANRHEKNARRTLKASIAELQKLRSKADALTRIKNRVNTLQNWALQNANDSNFVSLARDKTTFHQWVWRMLEVGLNEPNYDFKSDAAALTSTQRPAYDPTYAKNCRPERYRAILANSASLAKDMLRRLDASFTLEQAEALAALANEVFDSIDPEQFLHRLKQTAHISHFNAFTIENLSHHSDSDERVRLPESLKIRAFLLPSSWERSNGVSLDEVGDKAPFYSFYRDKILRQLKAGRMVSASIQAGVLYDPKIDTEFRRYGPPNQRHAVAIMGFRCKAGQPQYLIQNSWGKASKFTYAPDYEVIHEKGRVWIPETPLLNNTGVLETVYEE